MEGQCDAAVVAVLLAVAVARVENRVDIFGVEGDKTKPVSDELIGQNRCVGFDFDEVDCDGGHFGEDDAAEGVGESEIDICEDEPYGRLGGLISYQSQMLDIYTTGKFHLADGHSRTNVLHSIHSVVIHD